MEEKEEEEKEEKKKTKQQKKQLNRPEYGVFVVILFH